MNTKMTARTGCRVLLACTLTLGLMSEPAGAEGVNESAVLAFGSCLRQWQPMPLLASVVALSPRAFVFLDDTVYADVGDYMMLGDGERIEKAYADINATPEFRAFRTGLDRQGTRVYATWDDHDYGLNDAGAEFAGKREAKQAFLEFFGLDATASGGAEYPGVYQNHHLALGDLDVNLILLDTRSFRSPLKKRAGACNPTDTVANTDDDATMLGEQQWAWLEKVLAEPADLRIIASSIQVIPEEHCFEKWANFPAERERLFALIRDTQSAGVVLISGDRHLSEVSVLPAAVIGYPLYEVTSSGLNSGMGLLAASSGEPNGYREGENFTGDSFGAIEALMTEGQADIMLTIRSIGGEIERRVKLDLSELAF